MILSNTKKSGSPFVHAALIWAALLLLPSLSGAQTGCEVSFTFTGGLQSWTVPPGVTSINIEAAGAKGGGTSGGLGAKVAGDFTVTPGETLQIIVADQGGGGTFGGGGGASFMARGSNGFSDFTAANILLIGGGGGGAASAGGQSSTVFQPDAMGSGGIATDEGAGGGSAEQNGANARIVLGGRAAINGAAGFDGGGFGGGGGGDFGGGGGGGATGGNGGSLFFSGSAGTSYNGGGNPVNTGAANSGNGYVIIRYSDNFAPTAVCLGEAVDVSVIVDDIPNAFNSPLSLGGFFGKFGQTFQATATGLLSRIDVEITSTTTPGVITLNLYPGNTDPNNLPTTPLGTASFAKSEPNGATVPLIFDSPVAITAGTSYLMIVTATGEHRLQTANITNGDPYPIGIFYDFGINTNSFQPFLFNDIVLKTYVLSAGATSRHLALDAGGNAGLTAADLDGGSSDACGGVTLALSPTIFTCSDIGAPVPVTLTVTDGAKLSAECTVDVTVVDPTGNCLSNAAPDAACQPVTVNADANCEDVTTVAADFDGGSTDPDGDALTFSVSPEGPYPLGVTNVVLTVDDGNGETATCSTTITVVDGTAPTAVCQNITVNLNTSGFYSLNPNELDGGSTDNCGTVGFGINTTVFDCDDVGETFAIELTVSDNSANFNRCTAQVTVEDNVAPVALCQTFTVQLDANGSTSITATDIDDGSTDNCGSVTLSISGATTFDCDDVGIPQTVTLTVTDGSNNSSGCDATVTVADDDNPCTTISGNILWEHDLSTPVPGATVTLSGDDTGSDATDANGEYAMPTFGGNLTLTPTKTGGEYEGVDVADVTRIQQHVTFIDRLDDGYKVIAADVNQSNSVTGLDAAVIFHSLNGNSSAQAIFKDPAWRFVEATHTFIDENAPWTPAFPEDISLMNVMADVLNQDFVGVKMGDVNGTWGAPPAPLTAPLNWTVPNLTLKAGQTLRVPFRANGLPDVAAWQFALRFDTDYLRFERALPTAAFPLKDENFGAWQADRGELRSVFAVPQGLVLPKGEVLFELEFQVVYDGLRLSEVLRLDDDILDGRVYNTALNSGAIALAFEAVGTRRIASLLPGEAALGFALEQNMPNPFSNETLVRFELPEAGDAVFSVHDVQGRLLYEQRGFLDAGLHEVRLDAARLGATGVLSYTLRSGAHSATRRMVVVR